MKYEFRLTTERLRSGDWVATILIVNNGEVDCTLCSQLDVSESLAVDKAWPYLQRYLAIPRGKTA